MFTELCGWIGSLMFAICAFPQMLQSVRDRHSNGLNPLFLAMWVFGELFTFIYIVSKSELDYPLILNYAFNLMCLIPITYYKLFPRKSK